MVPKSRLNITINTSTKDKLAILANNNDVSMSMIIKIALEYYLKGLEEDDILNMPKYLTEEDFNAWKMGK